MLWQHIMLCENMFLRVQLARVCVVRYIVKDWRVLHYVAHNAHPSKLHSQEHVPTQHDMLPQHPVSR